MKSTSIHDKIIISTYKTDGLYFSVGISSLTHRIVGIALPHDGVGDSVAEISRLHQECEVSDEYIGIAKTISRIYKGEKINFELESLDLKVTGSKNIKSVVKTPFEREVLIQTAKIPSGDVRTYKYIAEKLGSRAYRAVGTALGKNPFPIVIPCHRVVKSNMKIGEYRGGSEMKKEILENEGVRIIGDKIIK
jgi:methylated-DNA-[protein]-cysteine S-methyltransferase